MSKSSFDLGKEYPAYHKGVTKKNLKKNQYQSVLSIHKNHDTNHRPTATGNSSFQQQSHLRSQMDESTIMEDIVSAEDGDLSINIAEATIEEEIQLEDSRSIRKSQ